MEKELLELRDRMWEAEREHEKKSIFYSDLELRAGESQLQANNIAAAVERAEQDRVKILEEVVNGTASEKDVLGKSEAIATLKMKLKDKTDLIDTLKKTLAESRPQLEKFGASAIGASHQFWYRVFEIEKAKLEAAKDNPLGRAYAAMLLSGVGVDFGTFVIQHFREKFNLDISETTKRLEKEFLEKGGGR